VLKSTVKQNCKPVLQHSVLNGPHFETWTRREPEITIRTRHLFCQNKITLRHWRTV